MSRRGAKQCARASRKQLKKAARNTERGDVLSKSDVVVLLSHPHIQLGQLLDKVLCSSLCSQIYVNSEQSYGWLQTMTHDCVDVMRECGKEVSNDNLQQLVKESFENFAKYFRTPFSETDNSNRKSLSKAQDLCCLNTIAEESASRTDKVREDQTGSKSIKRLQFIEITPTNCNIPKVYRKTPWRGFPVKDNQMLAEKDDSMKKINEASQRREQFLEQKVDRVRRDREERAQRVAYNRNKENERKRQLLEKHEVKRSLQRRKVSKKYIVSPHAIQQVTTRDGCYPDNIEKTKLKNTGITVESTPEDDMESMKQKRYVKENVEERQVVPDSLHGSDERSSHGAITDSDGSNSTAGEYASALATCKSLFQAQNRSRIHATQEQQMNNASTDDGNKSNSMDDTIEIFTPKTAIERQCGRLVASYVSSSSSSQHLSMTIETTSASLCNKRNPNMGDTAMPSGYCEKLLGDSSNDVMKAEAIGYEEQLGEAPMEVVSSEASQRDGVIYDFQNDETPKSRSRIRTTSTKFSKMLLTSEESEETEDANNDDELKKEHEGIGSIWNINSRNSSSSLSDYGITDLSSNDETDPEDSPKKKIPSWAQGMRLRQALRQQRTHPPVDIDNFFGCVEVPQLGALFVKQKNNMSLRSTSGLWESPISNPRIGKSAIEAASKGTHDFNRTIRLPPYKN